MKTIDFNCDLGEGMENDAEIMSYISSCNIACGGHAGDLDTMNKTVLLAKAHEVKIGAHPSYPDRENFGRRVLCMSPSDLERTLVNQIHTLENIASRHGLKLHHIKLHGALYHQAARDPSISRLTVQLLKNNFFSYALYVPFLSLISKTAKNAGLKIKYEAFADRNYNADLSLVNRKLPNAMLSDHQEVLEHLERILKEGKVKAISGELVPILADTICLHGDHPGAVSLAAAIHTMLIQEKYITK